MPLRTFVSFKADFPTDGQPAGKKLADFILTALRVAGIEHTGPEDREGWAWDIYCKAGKIQIECIIGFMDDDPREWLITTYGHGPLLLRLFGGGGKARETALRPFCEAIDSAIKQDDRFSSIRWYLQKDWDALHSDTWGEIP